MTKIYADLIRKGLKTINDVPEKLKAEVQAILDSESNVV
ncbi:CD1375 family protein [Oscillibacter sp.]|nr:CD1375 family protein [Oscillibacter sp.]MDD3347324.1 CD1375 family protein [Oscillibacter sp.]